MQDNNSRAQVGQLPGLIEEAACFSRVIFIPRMECDKAIYDDQRFRLGLGDVFSDHRRVQRRWIASSNPTTPVLEILAIPYAQAFLATDLLIEQRGLSAVIDYFRRVPNATDLMQNFQAAFGVELATFQHEFTAYLESLLGWSQPNAAPLAEVRVDTSFKLTVASARAWIDDGYRRPE